MVIPLGVEEVQLFKCKSLNRDLPGSPQSSKDSSLPLTQSCRPLHIFDDGMQISWVHRKLSLVHEEVSGEKSPKIVIK